MYPCEKYTFLVSYMTKKYDDNANSNFTLFTKNEDSKTHETANCLSKV